MSVATMHSPLVFPPPSPSTRIWNTSTMGCGTGRKPIQISRCLFGPPDPQEATNLVRNMELQISLKFGERFNFDVINEKPLDQPPAAKKMKITEKDEIEQSISKNAEQAYQWTEADNQQLAMSFLFAPVVTNFINRYLSYTTSLPKATRDSSAIPKATTNLFSKISSELLSSPSSSSSTSSSKESNNNIATYPNKQDIPAPVAIATTAISVPNDKSSKISPLKTSPLKSKRKSPYSTKRSSGKRAPASSSSSIIRKASRLALHHMINKMNHAATTCLMTKKAKASSTITDYMQLRRMKSREEQCQVSKKQ